jgi:hypothetical protein
MSSRRSTLKMDNERKYNEVIACMDSVRGNQSGGEVLQGKGHQEARKVKERELS